MILVWLFVSQTEEWDWQLFHYSLWVTAGEGERRAVFNEMRPKSYLYTKGCPNFKQIGLRVSILWAFEKVSPGILLSRGKRAPSPQLKEQKRIVILCSLSPSCSSFARLSALSLKESSWKEERSLARKQIESKKNTSKIPPPRKKNVWEGNFFIPTTSDLYYYSKKFLY